MKDQYFQTIRGLCIVCVVVIHSLLQDRLNIHNNEINIIIRTIINFAVGIFIFLSGYFIKDNDIRNDKKDFYKKRLKRLLIPYIIWSSIYIVLFHLNYIKNINIKSIISAYIFGNSAVHLYFIVALLQLILITPLLIKVMDKNSRFINLSIIMLTPIYTCINGLFNYYTKTNFPLYATLFPAWISFYYMGMLYNKQIGKIKKINSKFIFFITSVILIINISVNLIEYWNGMSYSYCTSQIKLSNSIYIICIAFSIIAILNIVNTKKIKSNVLSKIGDNSFGIYFMHLILIKLLKKIFEDINCILIVKSSIIAVITLIICVVLIKIINELTKNKSKLYLGF